jgi:cobalt-zinc-cadmium resistance protein CzcA
MLTAIVDLSLRYKLLVLVAFTLVVFLGVRAFQQVPVDAFPDVTPVQVVIYTESPGLAAEDVETLLTAPIETSMAGLPGVEQVRSVSLFGLSYVTVYFTDSTDVYFARRLVGEKLAEAKARLPAGYGEPELGPNSTGLGQVLWYTIEATDPKISNMDLRTLQDWTVRLLLRTAPGVDDVVSWGGLEKQYQIQIDPRRLIKYGLGFREVVEAIDANNRQVGGQYIDRGKEQFLIRGLGRVANVSDIENVVIVTRENTPIRIRDVAEVKEAPGLRFGAVTRDGKEVVLGIALQRFGENAAKVAEAVKAKLDVARKALPEGVTLTPVYDRTELVDKAVGTAVRALIEGSILVAIVLFLFLGELRSCAGGDRGPAAGDADRLYPACRRAGLSANLMSLAGLAIGIGMMVDGAVVMVENAYRIMAERKARWPTKSQRDHLQGRRARGGQADAFAILIIIVVFLPLFSLQGLEGKLFKPMAFNITFAMIGSLILTMTLIPVLAALVLKPKEEKDTRLVALAEVAATPACWRGRWHVASGCSAWPWPRCWRQPRAVSLSRQGVHAEPEEGAIMWRITSIYRPPRWTNRSGCRIRSPTLIKQKFPEVQTTLAMIGRAEKGETADVNYMEVYTPLKPKDQWRRRPCRPGKHRNRDAGCASTEALPTAVVSYTQPIQMRIEELISGVRATLALKIYGDDLGDPGSSECALKNVLAGVPGVADLALEANIGKPQIASRSIAMRWRVTA